MIHAGTNAVEIGYAKIKENRKLIPHISSTIIFRGTNMFPDRPSPKFYINFTTDKPRTLSNTRYGIYEKLYFEFVEVLGKGF